MRPALGLRLVRMGMEAMEVDLGVEMVALALALDLDQDLDLRAVLAVAPTLKRNNLARRLAK